MRRDTVTIVGKGPSAVRANEFIEAAPDTAVCSINDALKLVTCRETIDYLFFTDVEMIEAAREHWPRVKLFVCTERLHKDAKLSELTIKDIEGFPSDRCLEYPYRICQRHDRESLRVWVQRRIPTHQCTAMGAQSWLAYSGFTRIRLIGIDGGTNHAPGLSGVKPMNYSKWVTAHEALRDVLHEEMGVTTEWHVPT